VLCDAEVHRADAERERNQYFVLSGLFCEKTGERGQRRGGEESCALGGPLSPGEGARDRALLCAQEPGVDPPKVKVVRHTVHFLLFIVYSVNIGTVARALSIFCIAYIWKIPLM
jgi:hypothetical protein